MRDRRFIASFILVIIFEILIILVRPLGLSLFKVSITLLVWLAFYFAFSAFVRNYDIFKKDLPKYAFTVLGIMIGLNIINIFRSLISGDGTLTTLFGNSNTSLALLVPFTMAFSFDKVNLRLFNNFFIWLIPATIILYLIFVLLSSDPANLYWNKSFHLLIYETAFLVILIPLQSKRDKFIIIAGTLLLSWLAVVTEYRVVILRILLLYLLLIPVYYYMRKNTRWIPVVVLLTLFIPFYLIKTSIKSKVSPFEKILSRFEDMEMGLDTRTFLYQEVYEDLRKDNKLLIGRGSNGTYYSPYFDETGGDTSNRLSVEVGILAILLKGGLISVALYLIILCAAIYQALFRSKNYYVFCIGLMLVVHALLLFISNPLDYSCYNMAIWFFTGVCLSKKIRSLDNSEIKIILTDANQLS